MRYLRVPSVEAGLEEPEGGELFDMELE